MGTRRVRWLRWLAVAAIITAAALCTSDSDGSGNGLTGTDWTAPTFTLKAACVTHSAPLAPSPQPASWGLRPGGTAMVGLLQPRGLPNQAVAVWSDRLTNAPNLDGVPAEVGRVLVQTRNGRWNLALGLQTRTFQGGAPAVVGGLDTLW